MLPIFAVQGRWDDSSAVALNSNIFEIRGNPAVEVSETVGAFTGGSGGNFISILRAQQGRTVEIRTPGFTRSGFETYQLQSNSEQLGTDERLIITGAAPVVTNGMVEPWMITATNSEFLTYNADTGFTKAGFTRNQPAATLAANLNAPTDRTIVSGAVVLNAGVDLITHGLRLDGDVTLGTATDNTAQLIIGSGGLLTTGTRVINAGVVAGSIAIPAELIVWNSGTTTFGDVAAANRKHLRSDSRQQHHQDGCWPVEL